VDQRRCYLDYNATAPIRPGARARMLEALDLGGNPSSVHREGRAARALVEAARGEVAALAGVEPRNCVFTASGTEAANLALTPAIAVPGRGAPERLIVSAGEHACVLAGHRFAPERVAIAPLGADGRIDLASLATMLAGRGPTMLALQAANNETGVIQPVAEAARLVHAAGGVVVCDAVQRAGRLPLDGLGADILILSAHKLGGPTGAGAMALADRDLHVAPLLRGGGQERGVRAGTENVAALAGFGAACVEAGAAMGAEAARLTQLREGLLSAVLAVAPDAVIFGGGDRLPNTLSFSASGLSAETLLIALDLDGVAVSSGSACSSGKVARSHVLKAMGVSDEVAAGAIRLSLGWASGAEDVARFADAFGAIARRARRRNAA
jgi:cysteine desulfurase